MTIREKKLGKILIGILVVFFLLVYWVQSLGQIRNLKEIYDSLGLQEVQLESELGNARNDRIKDPNRAALTSVDEILQEFSSVIPSTDFLVSLVQSYGSGSGVQLQAVRVSERNSEVSATVIGTPHSILEFLKNIQDHRPLIGITYAVIQPRSPGVTVLEIRIAHVSI